MPSNVFATTGTNVSVLFFDMAKSHDKVVLIDASHLGETLKDGNTQRTFLQPDEIDKIVNSFKAGEPIEDFCATPTYDEIKDKGYSLSAGQYFDIKIDYVDITEEEFNQRMSDYKQTLTAQFAESRRLEKDIMEQLNSLQFNAQ
jgi:type I restriction enzyme M protein